MRWTSFRVFRPHLVRRALGLAGSLTLLGVSSASAAEAAPALALPPLSPMTVAVLFGGAVSMGFFGLAFLLDQLKEGGAPEGLKMTLGAVGAGGLAVTALVLAVTWPGRGYPQPEPDREWRPEMQQARLDGIATLDDYGVTAEEGRYRVPIDRAMQVVVDDPSLLEGKAIVLDTPWEEMPLADRGRLIYEGLAMQQTSSVAGYAACKTCHSTDGTRILGPSFQGRWGQPAVTSAGTVTFDEAYVIESTREPNAKVADTYPPVMPAMQLTDEQLQAIIAFLKTL